jgi:hypothetical protein
MTTCLGFSFPFRRKRNWYTSLSHFLFSCSISLIELPSYPLDSGSLSGIDFDEETVAQNYHRPDQAS